MAMQAKNEVDQLLAQSLKELAVKRPVEKITIKEITDKAGVIRPTFYNHFQDKFELIEWIIKTEILEPIGPLLSNGMITEGMELLFSNIAKDKPFYEKIIENLLTKVDNLIIAGGMTYTFVKAQGGKIGNSICEDDKLDLALELMEKAKKNNVNLVLAVDAKIADKFDNNANTEFVNVNEIPDGWEGLDIGPKSQELFADVIRNSKTILWNGPTGVFEFDNFIHGSLAVAKAIVEATEKGAYSLIGGGDSVACINKFGLADKVSYVSTGGGALLEAIEGKTLPGIAAIKGE